MPDWFWQWIGRIIFGLIIFLVAILLISLLAPELRCDPTMSLRSSEPLSVLNSLACYVFE